MWVPIALSRDVPNGVTRAVILGGRELVIWRGESGSAQIWEDRCPHRGMRLSLGFVRGDSLNCLYHGWEYGPAASCRRIPAHPDLTVPNTIRAKAFGAEEAGGMIWMREVGESPMPHIQKATPVATIAVEAPAQAILAFCAAAPRGDAQVFGADLDGIAFQIGWHAVSETKTMLHAAATDATSPNVALDALLALRDRAEARIAA